MEILEREKIGDKSLRVIINRYATQTAQMRMEPTTKISIIRGVRQGCILPPTLYHIYAEEALKEFGRSKGTTIGSARINRLMYAEDTAILSDTKEELKEVIDELMEKGRDFGLTINFKKAKVMKISRTGEEETPINIRGKEIEAVTTFNYLGVMFQNNDKENTEVRRRIGMAKQAFWQNKILLRGDLSQKLKRKILGTMIFPLVCYGSELWPETVKIRKIIDAFEHWTIRRLLKISWTERIANEEVRKQMNMENMILGPKIKDIS